MNPNETAAGVGNLTAGVGTSLGLSVIRHGTGVVQKYQLHWLRPWVM
jgi:hypothetical protein